MDALRDLEFDQTRERREVDRGPVGRESVTRTV